MAGVFSESEAGVKHESDGHQPVQDHAEGVADDLRQFAPINPIGNPEQGDDGIDVTPE